MATLTATIKLSSSNATSDALSLSEGPALTVGAPMDSLSRKTLTTAVTNLVPTSSSAIVYFYAKNMDTTQVVVLESITGTQSFSDLSPGEVCFFPVKGTIGLRAKSAADTAVLEYGYWTKA